MYRNLISPFAALAIALAPCAAGAGELDDRQAVKDEAEEAYSAGDFASLERQYLLYSDFQRQRTPSGAFKMTLFQDGIGEAKRDYDEEQFKQDIERTARWVATYKTSPLAYVLHANALSAYGGYFRGGGYANTVTPQAWKIYEEYVRKGEKVLRDNAWIADKDTSWHAAMLNFARRGDWPQDAVIGMFEAGMKKNPADPRLYFNMLEYVLPKWHGSVQAVDHFIRYVAERSPAAYGTEFYARLYSSAEQSQFGRRMYNDTLVDWKKMNEGLALWVQRFPTSWNRNIYAYHACIAGDKGQAKKLLAEIGAEPEWTVWEPSAKATYDTCVRWAADPAAEPLAPRESAADTKKAGRSTPDGV